MLSFSAFPSICCARKPKVHSSSNNFSTVEPASYFLACSKNSVGHTSAIAEDAHTQPLQTSIADVSLKLDPLSSPHTVLLGCENRDSFKTFSQIDMSETIMNTKPWLIVGREKGSSEQPSNLFKNKLRLSQRNVQAEFMYASENASSKQMLAYLPISKSSPMECDSALVTPLSPESACLFLSSSGTSSSELEEYPELANDFKGLATSPTT